MKDFRISAFAPLTALMLVLGVGTIGANAQTSAATPAPTGPPDPCLLAQQTPSIPQNLPEGFVPPTEEEDRYSSFFMQLYVWDQAAKQAEANGDSGWAGHFRTTLERESGLKPSEATQVKQIVFQYLSDEEAWQKRFSDAGTKERAAHPNVVPSDESPEITALRREHSDLLNKAIADLVTALGSRSFSKLDLFTRHMNDQMKANLARQQAGCPNSGVK